MKIKRIEICGFKSFVDRTQLSFPDPVTAIVGPNGCGKSNIVDAIRWVMGEQSAKHLRGRAMEDVIFAGSESRGPHGFAEVSLTFDARSIPGDAAPGGVPWGAAGPEEVVVTRRLFRSGESEYLLNGVPARLRDIVEFFLGTGVGSKAYAIIEQGRVGFIVSSRPEDRRSLIDEAAGITKYKAKKKAAERRMEATRQHLLRVSDIIAEIDSRLRSLRLAAQKAERYKRYRQELKDLDLWASSQQFLGLLAHEKALAAALEVQEESHRAEAATLAASEAHVSAERMGVDEDRRDLDAARDELYSLQNRAQLATNRAQHLAKDAGDLDKRADDASLEAAEIQTRGAAQAQVAQDLVAQLERLKEEVASVEVRLGADQAAHDHLRSELTQKRGELQTNAALAGTLGAALARHEALIANAASRSTDLEGRVAHLAAEDGGLTARLDALGGELERLTESFNELVARRASTVGRAQAATAERDRLRQALSDGELKLDTLREESHRRRSRLKSLSEIEERYESFQRGVRAIMQKAQGEATSGVKGLVADIVQPPPDLETAVEAVLGERLGNIIVESHDVGVEAIAFLKERSEGRSSFIPMGLRGSWVPAAATSSATAGGEVLFESPAAAAGFKPWPTGEGVRGPLLDLIGYDKRYDKIATYLLGDVLVVENLNRALDLWRETRTEKTIVTLDGDVVDPRGVVTGGSREAAAVGVLGQRREMRELEEVVAKIDADVQAAVDAQVETKRLLGEVLAEIESLVSAERQAELDELSCRKDLERAREDAGRLTGRRAEIAAQIAETRRALDALATSAAEAHTALERDRASRTETEARAGALREDVDRLEKTIDVGARALVELRIVAAQAGDRMAHARSSLDDVQRERSEGMARVERLTHAAEADRLRAATARTEARQLEDEAALLAAEADERVRAHAERQGALETRTGALAQREATLRTLRTTVTDLADAVTDLRLRRQEAGLRRTSLEEQTAARYPDVVLAAVIFDHHLRPAAGPAEEARQTELRGLIDRMGPVNLTAIEESAELQQRFEFLTTQRSDLESALGQLERAIDKINRTSRKRFEETFEAINERFRAVFPRLFGGGHAELVLTNPSDLLETGVEISANPPGKKVAQNIELLSGGEKALTAVSLLFAIFLVKPSPFCILDEVDAPLDEANVGRFNQMLREMTGRSQFIVITHKIRTMEIADRLCGVTMEEPGVSKLVAVNLRGRAVRNNSDRSPVVDAAAAAS